jgi:hypothetical protein
MATGSTRHFECVDLQRLGLAPRWRPNNICIWLRFDTTQSDIHRPTRPIASVGYPEAGESLIRRIAQRRLLASFHNQCLNQLVHGV